MIAMPLVEGDAMPGAPECFSASDELEPLALSTLQFVP